MKKILFISLLLGIISTSQAQNTFPTAGNVGIGTSTPATDALLHIKTSNTTTGNVIFQRGVNAPTSIAISGAGGRLMWVPSKNAFRTGYVNDTQWDYTNIGTYSNALGYNVKATTTGTTAIGYNSTASGVCATTLGYYNTSSGTYSTSWGSYNTASGSCATALGNNTTAQSFASLVLGRYNTISGATSSWLTIDPILVVGNGTSSTARSNALTLLKNGNLGLGKDAPLAKLDIVMAGTNQKAIRVAFKSGTSETENFAVTNEGIVRAREVIVTLDPFPDYVFEDTYQRMPLGELKNYIEQNKHLPNMPTAKEVAEKGMNLGEIQSKLVEKVEELTLYLLELKAENEQLKAANVELRQSITAITNQK